MNKLLIAVVLATAAASPSFAATVHHRHATMPGQTMATPDETAFDSYAMARNTGVVVQDGQVLGADPDPFIREQMMREGNPADYSGS